MRVIPTSQLAERLQNNRRRLQAAPKQNRLRPEDAPRCRGFYRGFWALESLVVLLIVLLLLFYTLRTLTVAADQTHYQFQSQSRWNTLVSLADYIVASGAAMGNTSRYPSWINEENLNALPLEVLADRFGASGISVGFDPGEGECIYRLVVVGPQKEIRRLFVCAEWSP